MPRFVQSLRVLDDGTWAIATQKDPRNRNGMDEKLSKVRWIAAEHLPPEAAVEPTPVHIDRRGHAWYRPLETNLRSFWLVAGSEELVQYTTQLRFTGPPRETRSGDIWLAAQVPPSPGGADHHLVQNPQSHRLELLRIPRQGNPESFHGLTLPMKVGQFAESPRGDLLWWNAPTGLPPSRSSQMQTVGYLHGTGCFTATFDLPFHPSQIHIDHTGRWYAMGYHPSQRHRLRLADAQMPQRLQTAVAQLGAGSYTKREAAEATLRAKAGTWHRDLATLAAREEDPEIRVRLEQLLEAQNAPAPAEEVARAEANGWLPQSERLVRPSVLQSDMVVLAGADLPTDWTGPQAGWQVFGVGKEGEVVSIASNLPSSWAPSPGLPNEQVGAFDMAKIDEDTWAWRDALGHLCIWRNGVRLELDGIKPLNPAFPLAQCRLLSVWPSGFAIRIHREVVIVPKAALGRARKISPPPPAAHPEETEQKIKQFIQSYRNYYDTDLTHEELCRQADDIAALIPEFWLGDYVRGSFRAGQSSKKRLTLEAINRAMGHQRDHQLLDSRANTWGALGKFTEQIRDMNLLVAMTGATGSRLSSLHLERGNVYLEAEDWSASIRDFEAALHHHPSNQIARNNIAWVLATAPDPNVRDGKRAIELATKVCTFEGFREAYSIDTLAAAYAEAGNFLKAVEMQEKAMELVDPEEERWQEFHAHLKRFKNKKPVRIPEPSLPEPKDIPPPVPEGL